jgi:hypothetical protein
MRASILVFLLGAAACAPKAAPVAPAAAPAPAPLPSVAPVHFSSGSKNIAAGDAPVLEAALQAMRADPALTVTLLGYTDSDGDPAANVALSEARASYVRNFLTAGGIEASRVTLVGQGEAGATGDATHDRRVDFAFSRQGSAPLAAAPAPAAGPAAATESSDAIADAAPAEKPAKAKKAPGEPKERKAMKPIGITDLDAFFAKVQVILDRVYTTEDALISARDGLIALVGVGEGATLDTALAEAVKTAQGSLTFSFAGGKPALAVKPNPSPQVKATADALNGLVNACVKIATELPKLQGDAMALVEEAKAIPAKVPQMAKDIGASPTQLPKMLGAVKSNVATTIAVPGEVKGLIDEGVATVNLLKAAFGTPG